MTRRTLALVLSACLSACAANTMQVTEIGPQGTKVSNYSGYFDTRTILVPGRVGLDLVVDVEKKQIPIVHGIAQSLGALGPSDMDATGLFTAYLHNLTLEAQTLRISAMTHEGQPIPDAIREVILKPDSYEKVVLGRVHIFSYARDLKVQMSYAAPDTAPVNRTLVVIRQSQVQLDKSVQRWKGKKKNVPEFFPD